MNLPAAIEELRSALPSLEAIYVFGSHAQGAARADSDLDLAVLTHGMADPVELWSLSSKLSDIVQCPVDLIDLRAASTVMQYQVITTGQRCWNKGSHSSLFESFVLSEKTALDEARAGVLLDIQASGQVYGR